MGGFTACSYPSLPVWQLLSDVDRSGRFLQAEDRKLGFDRLGAFHILPWERSWGLGVTPNTTNTTRMQGVCVLSACGRNWNRFILVF